MTTAITDTQTNDEIDALHQLASMVINDHIDLHGLCAVCGCAFPCERAVFAEHNLLL